jgi:cytidylate kinase
MNLIYSGSAGTGKTTEAIYKAVEIVTKNENNKTFQELSKKVDLEIKFNSADTDEDKKRSWEKINNNSVEASELSHLETEENILILQKLSVN